MGRKGLVQASLEDIGSRCGLAPDHPCGNCGCVRWWWRASQRYGAGWVCGRCHPEPRRLQELPRGSDEGLQPLSAILTKLPITSRYSAENGGSCENG